MSKTFVVATSLSLLAGCSYMTQTQTIVDKAITEDMPARETSEGFGGGNVRARKRYVVTYGDFRGTGQDDLVHLDKKQGQWHYVRMLDNTSSWTLVEGGGPCTNLGLECGILGMQLPISNNRTVIIAMSFPFAEPPPEPYRFWHLMYVGDYDNGSPRVVWKEMPLEGVDRDTAGKLFFGLTAPKVYLENQSAPSILLRQEASQVFWRVSFDEQRGVLAFHGAISQEGPGAGEHISWGHFKATKNHDLFTYKSESSQWVLGTWADGLHWSPVHVGSVREGLICRPCFGPASPFGILRLNGDPIVDESMWLYDDGEIWSAAYFLGGMFWDRPAKVNWKETTIRTGDIFEEPSGSRLHDEIVVYNFYTGEWDMYYLNGTDWVRRRVADTTGIIGDRSYIHYFLSIGKFRSEPREQIIYLWYATGDIWIGAMDPSTATLSWQKLEKRSG